MGICLPREGRGSALTSPPASAGALLSSRVSGERGPAGADPAERRFQRPEGQVAAAQVGGAAGLPLRHLSNRGLCQGQHDGEDAHPAPGGGKGGGWVLPPCTALKKLDS